MSGIAISKQWGGRAIAYLATEDTMLTIASSDPMPGCVLHRPVIRVGKIIRDHIHMVSLPCEFWPAGDMAGKRMMPKDVE